MMKPQQEENLIVTEKDCVGYGKIKQKIQNKKDQ